MPSKIEQLAHILDGKAKFPCPPDEGQAMHVLARIAAVVAARAVRLGQQTDPFVVADGLNLRCGGLTDLPDAQPCHWPLTL